VKTIGKDQAEFADDSREKRVCYSMFIFPWTANYIIIVKKWKKLLKMKPFPVYLELVVWLN